MNTAAAGHNPLKPGTPNVPQTPEPPQPPETPLRFGPDHRDLYLLILGILAGVLLGPGVLGRLTPNIYDHLFLGSGPMAQRLETYDQTANEQLKRLQQTGVTATALTEKKLDIDRGRAPLQALVLQARMERQQQFSGLMIGALLGVVVVMVIEAMIDPRSLRGLGRRRGQLATIRYALSAIWLALLLAEPTALRTVPVLFVVVLVAVALFMALVPLGWLGGKNPALPKK